MSTKKVLLNDRKAKKNKSVLLFFVSLMMAAGAARLIQEPGFTQAQIIVLFLLLFSVGLWLTEAVPPFSVGLLIIAVLALSLGYEKFTSEPVDVKIYTNTISSSVIWLMLGGFFLASAMTKVQLDRSLIVATMKICGTNPKWILLGMMTVTMISSMLISNTASTAMTLAALMPLLKKLGKKSDTSKALILGIPIAATTGGMGTMIGSPPNAIAAGALVNANQPIDFITWIYYGLPPAVLLTFIAWWVLVKMFMKKVSPFSLGETPTQTQQTTSTSYWMVIVVFVTTLLLWLTSPIHNLSAAAVAAVPLVMLPLTGILKGEDIRALGWDTLILVAGGLALGTALQQTGLLNLYASRISQLQAPPIVFYFILAYATMLFSNIMSNTASSTVLIPLGMAILPGHLTEVAFIIGLSASTALFLAVSTPPNAIAYSTGYINQKDFRIGGILIGLLGPAIIVLWTLLIYG